MSRARLIVRFAGPLVSFQDAGRPGHMRFGVAASGPMDRFAYQAGHAALSQPAGGTSIEVSLGGLVVECLEGSVSFAVTGGAFSVAQTEGWGVHHLRAGETLSIRAGAWGSWSYLSFAGRLEAARWLGQTATHSMAGFGGGILRAGDILEISDARLEPARTGPIPCPEIARPIGSVRVVIGPQERHFEQASLSDFLSQSFRLSDAFDRMGVRLDGPKLAISDALSIPSEPVLRGSIQVAGDGVPTILLADHGTTGGYPKIATVISADLDRLVQGRAGSAFRFKAVSASEAVAAARTHQAAQQEALVQIAAPRSSLAERLMRENLISGAVCYSV